MAKKFLPVALLSNSAYAAARRFEAPSPLRIGRSTKQVEL